MRVDWTRIHSEIYIKLLYHLLITLHCCSTSPQGRPEPRPTPASFWKSHLTSTFQQSSNHYHHHTKSNSSNNPFQRNSRNRVTLHDIPSHHHPHRKSPPVPTTTTTTITKKPSGNFMERSSPFQRNNLLSSSVRARRRIGSDSKVDSSKG